MRFFFIFYSFTGKKKHLSALHCSAVFTVVVEELSWSARVSCSLFHLIGHGLPVAIASLFLCAYHSLSPVLSLSIPLFCLTLSLSALTICLYAWSACIFSNCLSGEGWGMGVERRENCYSGKWWIWKTWGKILCVSSSFVWKEFETCIWLECISPWLQNHLTYY